MDFDNNIVEDNNKISIKLTDDVINNAKIILDQLPPGFIEKCIQYINKPIDEDKPQKPFQISNENRFKISDKINVELNNLANFLRSKPSIKIELGGHTDTRGKAEDNQKLSADRAKAVYNYLIQVEHIDASRLTFIGYGETNPIISDQEIAKLATEVEREKAHQTNRRTVYKIIAQ